MDGLLLDKMRHEIKVLTRYAAKLKLHRKNISLLHPYWYKYGGVMLTVRKLLDRLILIVER